MLRGAQKGEKRGSKSGVLGPLESRVLEFRGLKGESTTQKTSISDDPRSGRPKNSDFGPF